MEHMYSWRGDKMIAILPNLITLFRICGSVSLIFIKPLTIAFFIVYTLAGISDAIDGWIARRYHVTSELGTVLDTIADFLFYAVMLVKLLPTLRNILPSKIWIAVFAIIFVRICSYLLAAIKYRRFATLHTYLNKLTGITIFIVPYFIKHSPAVAICITVCIVAGLATLEELIIHIRAKKYDSSTKTLLFVKHKKTNGAV